MDNHMLYIIPESITGSQNNCTIETQVETVQLKWDDITTMLCSSKTYKLEFDAQVPAPPHRRVQNIFAPSPVTVLFYVNNLSVHLDPCVHLRKIKKVTTSVQHPCQYHVEEHLGCWSPEKMDGEPRERKQVEKEFSHRQSIFQAIQQNSGCRSCPNLTCISLRHRNQPNRLAKRA